MLVNAVNVLSQNKALAPVGKERNNWSNNNTQDIFARTSVKTSNLQPQIYSEIGKNYIKVVTFGSLANPLSKIKPAIQMKVTGVSHFQDNMKQEFIKQHNLFSINRLADSNWKDGDPLKFEIKDSQRGPKISLFSEIFGELGRVPDEIAPKIAELLKANPKDYRFELSNVIAGNTKGAPTIGLRVNLHYVGKTPDAVQEAFDSVLNDPEASKKALFYQPKTSPDEILKTILGFEAKENGSLAAKQMEEAVSNIVHQIDSPKTKKILLVGHCKPDGDTLGCILGLKNSINMVHSDKLVDCAVDDEITGLFRNKIPGIDSTVKHPYSQDKIDLLTKEIEIAKQNGDTHKVASLTHSLEQATDKSLLLDTNEKYDLVILMDIPSPTRFSSGFKKHIENAKMIASIDHHPLRAEEWDKAAETTGINMGQIIKNKLAWVAERVPAAAEQAVIIASKLAPEKNPLSPANFIRTANSKMDNTKLNAAVASFTTGMYTDTGGFSRTANLIPTDIINEKGDIVPVQNRPNFLPEGLSKWLFSLTPASINKKWLRDTITYDISDKKIGDLPETAREIMVKYAEAHKKDNKELGVGFIKASYDEMKEVLNVSQLDDLSTSFLDVQNAFKYSEEMSALKEPAKNAAVKEGAIKTSKKITSELEEGNGPYDNDRLAVFICESERAGDTNTEGIKSKQNALRFSFRSPEGSTHAELLATLFNGGGHGGAAGGHIKGEHVTLDSTFSVKVDGKKVKDKEALLSALQKNYKVMHDKNFSQENSAQFCSKIELVDDNKGENPVDIIEGLVKEIRLDQERKGI